MNTIQHAPISETVSLFGANRHLVGVMTRVDSGADPVSGSGAGNGVGGGPDRSDPRSADVRIAARVGVLLLNAGVVPRMGPHRFNVKLSRCMARHGHPVLRFDLSGQGDSGAAAGDLPHGEQVTRDIRDAIDRLQQEAGVESVLIVGICSGANQGWATALEDPRIVGLVMIDPYAYATRLTLPRYHLRRLSHRTVSENLSMAGRWLLESPARWRARRTGVVPNPGRKEFVAGFDIEQETEQVGGKLSVVRYAAGMQTLVDRDVRLLLVFTGTWARFYSYAGQFRDVFGRFGFASRVELDFVPQFDHTFTLVGAQQRMIRRIEAWSRDRLIRPMDPERVAATSVGVDTSAPSLTMKTAGRQHVSTVVL